MMDLFYSDVCLQHYKQVEHPESPIRVLEAISFIRRNWNGKIVSEADIAEAEHWVKMVHCEKYIETFSSLCESEHYPIDFCEAVMCGGTYDAALTAVGGALALIDRIEAGMAGSGYNLCRPPGHHCGYDRYRAFCYFNSAAVVACYLREKHGHSRVAIVDVDYHGGNGTQELFFSDKEVLTVSLHGDPSFCYPYDSGYENEVGEGEAVGTNMNVCLPEECGDQEYLEKFRDVVVPAIRSFSPSFLIVSLGFDGHAEDPIGKFALSDAAYRTLFGLLRDMANECCAGKVLFTLEGGYNPAVIANLSLNLLNVFSGYGGNS